MGVSEAALLPQPHAAYQVFELRFLAKAIEDGDRTGRMVKLAETRSCGFGEREGDCVALGFSNGVSSLHSERNFSRTLEPISSHLRTKVRA